MAALSFWTTARSSAIVLEARTFRMNCFTVYISESSTRRAILPTGAHAGGMAPRWARLSAAASSSRRNAGGGCRSKRQPCCAVLASRLDEWVSSSDVELLLLRLLLTLSTSLLQHCTVVPLKRLEAQGRRPPWQAVLWFADAPTRHTTLHTVYCK